MAATPQYGFMKFKGMSGRTYIKDVYASDVANALVNFDSGAGAGSSSETFWTPPEPVVLTDFGIHTGMVDTTAIRITKNGVPSGDTLRYAAHLDTSTGRPGLVIGCAASVKVSAIQIA